MTTPTRRRVRGRGSFIGVVLWLVLASSITLEQGQQAIAQWGSTATLGIIGLLVLLAVGPVVLIPLRASGRRVHRWVKGRFR